MHRHLYFRTTNETPAAPVILTAAERAVLAELARGATIVVARTASLAGATWARTRAEAPAVGADTMESLVARSFVQRSAYGTRPDAEEWIISRAGRDAIAPPFPRFGT